MGSAKQPFFSGLLRNERGFHRLFSNVKKFDDFELFHNEEFADDPIFNHFVVDESLLQNGLDPDDSRIEKAIQSAKSITHQFSLRTSIFLENFWPGSKRFEKIATELGYRVTDKMEILSKAVSNQKVKTQENFPVEVSFTEDVETWTKVFMSSFFIPRSWQEELSKREKSILQMSSTKFVLATFGDLSVGCLLTYVEPADCLGIYCVGTIPSQRGKGIARQLLAFSEAYALKIGCDILTLQTLTSDHVSPMYKKLGYITQFERDILWAPLTQ
jgi:N-acetylglutamate synthase-like GNAT family acetyltransferase